MLLALAKTDEDVYNIGEVYKQYNTMRHENEPRVSSIALDDPEALLRDKQIRDSSSGEMLVKNELSFSERYLKRRSAPPSSHSTYKPYGTERVERRWDIGFDFLQGMVERGELTQEEAKLYPGKNLITRAIGTDATVECDLFHLSLEREDSILLCTDGLSNLLDEQEILFEVVHGVRKSDCCQRLLDIAKNRGAPDNVTSVLIAV